ncbi:FAD:protein FMN transferase [Fusobacterium sp.]|uniref:FAD:protein FMN transferase n=2 Tax=Fusobacterium sp. TaxID=68766 RepID=UPI002610CDC8|nr:FAD:protein FMN transferase [Fusobacterium sp.]
MKKIKSKINIFFNTIVILMIFSLLGCQKSNEKRFSQEKFLFGTYIQMIIYSDNEKQANEIMKKAFSEIERIDNKFNSKNKNSIIYSLNESDKKIVKIDSEGKYIFDEVRKMYEVTEKVYDITVGPLLDLWGFGKEERKNVPSELEIKEVLKNIDFSKVEIIDDNLIVNGKETIDTGSFLKGYALEKAKEILINNGVKNGFISSVSSIVTIGEKIDGSPWKIGLQDPNNQEKRLGVVEIKNKSMGVSGDYQTYIEIDGKRYHHIMNKFTGYPIADKKMVAVICDSGFMADIYSTSFFGMKDNKILEFCEKNNVDVFIVKSDNSIIKTKNFNLK